MIPIRDTQPTTSVPVVTYLLIAVNVAVFLVELTWSEYQMRQFLYLFGLVPARYTHPQWAQVAGFPLDTYWPFLTHMFLHSGWLHILANMWVLWIFGDNVEDRMGPLRYIVFYLLCGLGAALTHMWANSGSTIPVVGASGAIAGVMGAYLFLCPRSWILLVIPIFFYPFFFSVPAAVFVIYWLLLQLLSGAYTLVVPGESGGVAWWAHVGGFLTGVVLHPLFKSASRPALPAESAGWRTGRY